MKTLHLKDGDIITIRTLHWREDSWQFSSPAMMLSPIVRFYDESQDHEQIMEDLHIDAFCNEGKVKEDSNEIWKWRGYNLETLNRRFREAMKGKKFPNKCYTAKETKVIIEFINPDDFGWREI